MCHNILYNYKTIQLSLVVPEISLWLKLQLSGSLFYKLKLIDPKLASFVDKS